MDFCDCMITEHINGLPTCNRCNLEIDQCECTGLRHTIFCPDNPDKEKLDKELGRA